MTHYNMCSGPSYPRKSTEVNADGKLDDLACHYLVGSHGRIKA